MDFALANRVAVVTGGTAGVGLATVEAFLAEGARVAFCARSADAVEREAARLADRYGAGVLGQVCDVCDDQAVAGFRDTVLGRFGRADVLVLNAGSGSRSTFATAT
ncbi:MAG: SDR family NAD(P)-dependent oxidoreductase, partial [Armatimonadetes bacterium]|nr:SDR family NAD(P)-dependent oxidoreductase [Armatimonadota bacterium]